MLRKGHILAILVIGVSVTTFLSISAQQNYEIPAWVKSVAGFWVEDRISDQEFGEGLSFLIDNKIIRVPEIEKLQQENSQLKNKVNELGNEVSRLEGELISEIIANQEQSTPEIEGEKNPVLRAIEQGEVKFYIKDVPRDNTENVQGAINEVKKLLQSQSNSKVRFTVVNELSNSNVMVSWIKDFGEHRIGTALPQHLNIGYGFSDCFGEWQSFDKETITRIIMHEIGHSLGFDHSTDKNNVMYEKGTGMRYDYPWYHDGYTDFKFEDSDGTVLDLCKGEYLIEIEIENDKLADISVYSHTAVGTFEFKGETYPEFNICEEYGVTSYKRTCSVEKSGTLNMFFGIINDDESEFRDYSVKVERLDKLPEINMNWDENSYRYPDIYSDIFG